MDRNNKNNTNETDQTGDVMSWVIIFILMFAFPPAGLIMLIFKMRSYAKPSRNSSQNAGTKTSDTAQRTVNQVKNAAGQASGTAQQAINQASAAAQSAIKEASAAAQAAIKEATGVTWQSPSQKTSDANHFYENETSHASAGTYAQKTTEKSKKASKNSNQLDKKTGKAISVILLLIAIALFIIGANTIVGAATNIWGGGVVTRWPEFWLGIFYFAGGFISLFSRNIVTKRLGRYKAYYAYIAGRSVVPMVNIAQMSGLSVKTVRRDIQKMIHEGYFDSGTYIDKELDSLILCGDTAEEMRNAATSFEDNEPTEQAAANQYMVILSTLRELKLSIADVTISGKIDRIEELTAKIFRIVEQYPEKKPQIRRFETYYLPTTMKLIRSYSTLEKQGVKGENILAAKENIGRVLDTLTTGYEQQLDQLFKSDAMDIEADITVLENLMAQDGLTGEKSEFKTMTGTG